MVNSRSKGARRERQAAADIAAAFGVRAERMGRSGKTAEDIDHDVPGVHFEAKGPARCAVWNYMEQAERDCGDKMPVVVVRADRKESLLIIKLADVRKLAESLAACGGTPIYPTTREEEQ